MRSSVENIPRRSHILVISPNVFFRSPRPAILAPERKLLGMACNSTPTSVSAIEHFLRIMEDTDAEAQRVFAEALFERGRAAERLEFVDQRWGTRAVFEQLDETYEWNQQAGPLEWGEQQISPPGELSVLPMEILQLDDTKSLRIDGEIALCGYPILNSGTGRSSVETRPSAMVSSPPCETQLSSLDSRAGSSRGSRQPDPLPSQPGACWRRCLRATPGIEPSGRWASRSTPATAC